MLSDQSRALLWLGFLHFDSRDAAEEYARERGIDYVVTEPKLRKPNIRPRGYGENFAPDRKGAWTH